MTDTDFDSAPLRWKDRRAFYRRVAIAPICLCLVASLHVYRVRCCEQTPWKGGGFGMFSTVDQVGARYLRVYLLTDHGELPVAVPRRWQKQATELCAAPHASGLERLAAELADVRWHDASQRWESIALGAATAGGESLRGESLHSRIKSPAQPSDPFGMPLDVVTVSASDQPSRNLALVPVRDVRVELWRYEFDADTRQLRGHKFLESTTPKQGDA